MRSYTLLYLYTVHCTLHTLHCTHIYYCIIFVHIHYCTILAHISTEQYICNANYDPFSISPPPPPYVWCFPHLYYTSILFLICFICLPWAVVKQYIYSFEIALATELLLTLGNFMYSSYAFELHLPASFMSASQKPSVPIVVASPILNEWDVNFPFV